MFLSFHGMIQHPAPFAAGLPAQSLRHFSASQMPRSQNFQNAELFALPCQQVVADSQPRHCPATVAITIASATIWPISASPQPRPSSIAFSVAARSCSVFGLSCAINCVVRAYKSPTTVVIELRFRVRASFTLIGRPLLHSAGIDYDVATCTPSIIDIVLHLHADISRKSRNPRKRISQHCVPQHVLCASRLCSD